jgi:flagellar motility protein MotE (MotC chaperone)
MLIGLVVLKVIVSVFFLSDRKSFFHPFQSCQLAYAEDQTPPGDGKENQPDQPAEAPPAENPDQPVPQTQNPAIAETKITLESLEKKRQFLQLEEARIEEKRKQLEALKEEMEQKVVTLNDIHKQIDEKLQRIEKKETRKEIQEREAKEKKIKQLLKIYANMKPREVGAIIDNLEFSDALTIVLRMKGDQAAKILSYVNRDRAVKISEQLINAQKQSASQ